MTQRQRLQRRKHNGATYELLIGRAVVWRGWDLVAAFDRMARQHPKAKITVRLPQPHGLLVAIETF